MLLREKQFLDTPNGRPFTRQGSPVWPRCAIVNPNFRTACHSRMPRARACRTRHLANLIYNKHEEQHADSGKAQRKSCGKSSTAVASGKSSTADAKVKLTATSLVFPVH